MTITGSGTQADPWVLHTKEDLLAVSCAPTSTTPPSAYWAQGTYLKLGADIDMTGETWDRSIGIAASHYFGNFDGDGHTISHLYISTPTVRTPRSLFLYAGKEKIGGATIRNLTVRDSFISGKGYMSAFVSYGFGITMDNCHAINCYLSGPSKMAPFLTYAEEDCSIHISDCHAESCYCVTSSGSACSIGGIIGDVSLTGIDMHISDCTVNNCYIETINKDDSWAGGIYGKHDMGHVELTDCTVTNSTIIGYAGAGGLVGGTPDDYTDATMDISGCRVENCCIDGSRYTKTDRWGGYASWWVDYSYCSVPQNIRIAGCTGINNNIYGKNYETATLPAGNTETGTTNVNCYLTASAAAVVPAAGPVGTEFDLVRTGRGASLAYNAASGFHTGLYTAIVTDSQGTYYLAPEGTLRNDIEGTFSPSVVFGNLRETLDSVTASPYTVGTLPTGPVISVFTGSNWVEGTPYVFTGSAWVEATAAYVHDGTGWQETD